MKLENQVCSLELAKKLRELGVKQESVFVWHLDGVLRIACDPDERIGHMFIPKEAMTISPQADKEVCAAFTVAELGEILEPMSATSATWHDNEAKRWDVVLNEKILGDDIHFFSSTEADARAKMLIYLLENNLLK